ncbi:MAG: tRNA uridine-5-carboxymethylaminomethyl(34) synthesis GTPase MnmE [Syntrophaceae bacterium]|nr:tRNA uridine-5-carboxymethylaminomethyl(34) synthesis GTPase MnmE [Syntrophaceae bacterium]
MSATDTIVSIATPPGAGAIGIIRLSGPESLPIAKSFFQPSNARAQWKSHHLLHGRVLSHAGDFLDEVLLCWMRGPRSCTGEDVVEIHCHGGPVILQSVLAEVIHAGGRPAEPGEFTKRAFLNGRIDLAQAEAVADMIAARTEAALKVAASQLKGELSRRIESLRNSLTDVLVYLEAEIDFSDEDLEPVQPEALAERVMAIRDGVGNLLDTWNEGRLYRNGASVVIAGRSNVGKSSLLNRLLGEERAIVTPAPGTTRDFIEEWISLEGIPVKLADTAGVRDTEDPAETEGIRRVWEKISAADRVIVLLDGSEPLTEEDGRIAREVGSRKGFPVINKADLTPMIETEEVEALFDGQVPLWISAKRGDGIPELMKSLHRFFLQSSGSGEFEGLLSNARHKAALEGAQFFLSQAASALAAGCSPEVAACDVQDALDRLGDVVGKTTVEQVLERIFSTFCIGK